MNNFTLQLLKQIEDYANSKGFSKIGKMSFRKIESTTIENLWSIQIRKGRAPYMNYDYVSSTAGIYSKVVRKLEKKIISDFLNSYPLVGGATGLFTDFNEYDEFAVFDNETLNITFEKLILEFENGGLALFNKFNTLENIISGIDSKHYWFSDYFKNVTIRQKITIACMLFVN
ncbi:hypothetical protein [Flavobacterium tyrosinilyticum]|uniref:hypothetical protein n=1 Tax=Flavobacterium tyrosinilyticum TaxID=1658740 RepID=UPI00202FFC5B|nr:hypothetical protein [Flavobacterium tyrosinilyticum]MCM0667480.1 hypothetical protein [Flavobacterium tyrosinilyticum]